MTLLTRRALWAGAALAALGFLSFWVSWGLDAMLLADVALLAAVWLDARRASPLGDGGISVTREAPPAFSVGRPGEVSYRWRNTAGRPARLRLREVRPELLGGTQPPRAITVPPRGDARETVAVVPVRRGRERSGTGAFTTSPWSITVRCCPDDSAISSRRTNASPRPTQITALR